MHEIHICIRRNGVGKTEMRSHEGEIHSEEQSNYPKSHTELAIEAIEGSFKKHLKNKYNQQKRNSLKCEEELNFVSISAHLSAQMD